MTQKTALLIFLYILSIEQLAAMDFQSMIPVHNAQAAPLDPSSLSLRKAAKVGNIERVKQLLEQGKHLDSQGKPDILYMSWALKKAAASGYASIVELLLKANAFPDAGGLQSDPTPLMKAVQNIQNPVDFLIKEYAQVIELLLQYGADINAQRGDNQEFALWLAVKANSEYLIEFLIKHGARLELQTKNGKTALMKAAYSGRSGRCESAKALLKAGALVNAQTGEGNYNKTALCLAAQAGNDEMVKLLLDNGAATELPSSPEHTPLFKAVIRDHFEIVKLLLNRGANPNVLAGSTPLITAVSRRNFDIMDLLLDYGADAAMQSASGDIALYGAIHHCNQYMVEKLLAIPQNSQQEIRNCFTGLLAINRASQNKFPRDIRRLFASKFIEDYLEKYMHWFIELFTRKNKDQQKSCQDLVAERHLGPLGKMLCEGKVNAFEELRNNKKQEIRKILFAKPKPKKDRKKQTYYYG